MEFVSLAALALSAGTFAFLSFRDFMSGKSGVEANIKMAASLIQISYVSFSLIEAIPFQHASSPPIKYTSSPPISVSKSIIEHCISSNYTEKSGKINVQEHPDGGYNVIIVGKNFRFSGGSNGFWEQIHFFIDHETNDTETRLQFLDFDGFLVRSASDRPPEAGPRWDPFDAEMKIVAFRNGKHLSLETWNCIKAEGQTLL